jgi:23S rRNA (adenine2030-N6)-methyltransferase
VRAARFAREVATLLAPYLDVVATFNGSGDLRTYPGSPALVRAHLRPHDRLLACELEPATARLLIRQLGRDDRVRVVAIDGWTGLAAYVPPKERRGLVLVDPAFEQPDEFVRLADGLAAAHGKWATGTYLLWYPIKQGAERDAFARRLRGLAIAKILRAELTVAAPRDQERLHGTGLVVVNPPWKLERELAAMLPALAAVLGRDGSGGVRLDWLAGEK